MKKRADETFPWVTVWWTCWPCDTHCYTVFLRTASLFLSSDGIYSWGNLCFSQGSSYLCRTLIVKTEDNILHCSCLRKQEAHPLCCRISGTVRHTLIPCEDRLTPFINNTGIHILPWPPFNVELISDSDKFCLRRLFVSTPLKQGSCMHVYSEFNTFSAFTQQLFLSVFWPLLHWWM